MDSKSDLEPAREKDSGDDETYHLSANFESTGKNLARDDETQRIFQTTGWGAAFGTAFGPYGVLVGGGIGWAIGKALENRRDN